MTDFETLADLRMESFVTYMVAEEIGCTAIALIARDIHDEAGELIIELIGESE